MNHKIKDLLWDIHSDFLNSEEKLILLRLSDIANEKGHTKSFFLENLIVEVCIKHPLALFTLRSLQQKNILLSRIRKFDDWVPIAYQINIEELQNLKGKSDCSNYGEVELLDRKAEFPLHATIN